MYLQTEPFSLSRFQMNGLLRQLLQGRASSMEGDHYRPAATQFLTETIETDLRVVGCSGVEDRLQDNVPEIIEELRTCDIKFWVLTGDKPETVGTDINLAYQTDSIDRVTRRGMFVFADDDVVSGHQHWLLHSSSELGDV